MFEAHRQKPNEKSLLRKFRRDFHVAGKNTPLPGERQGMTTKNIPPLDWATFQTQIRFLGYELAAARHFRHYPGSSLWLACSSQPWTRPRGVRYEDHNSVAELLFEIRGATFWDDIRAAFDKLNEVNLRGVSRLSLPEALWAEKPDAENGKIGSYRNNEPAIASNQILWLDLDVADTHQEPKNGRYPLPTVEQARALLDSVLQPGDPAVIVASGSGSLQGYISVERNVEVEDFRRLATRLEEQHQVYVDQQVIGMRGPIRVWGHTRVADGNVIGQVEVIEKHYTPISENECFGGDGFIWTAADGHWVETAPRAWDRNSAAGQRYTARLTETLDAAEAAEREAKKKALAQAKRLAERRNQLGLEDESAKRPGDLFNEVIGSAVALLNATGHIVEERGTNVFVHRGHVPTGSDGNVLSITEPPANYQPEDTFDPFETIYLFSPNAAAALGLETERRYAPFDILAARCENDHTFAARILNATKADYDKVISLMAECKTRAQWEHALPAHTKRKRRKRITSFEDIEEVKQFNAMSQFEGINLGPYATPSEALLAKNGGNTEATLTEIRKELTQENHAS